MKSKKIISSVFAFFLMILGIGAVKAASTGTIGFEGQSQVEPNAAFTENIVISNISGDGKLMGVGGQVTVTDSSCITLGTIEVVDGSADSNGAKFSYLSMNGTNKKTTLVTVSFTAGASACSTTINIVAPTLSFTDGTNLKPSTISKTITVAAATPKSSDATLKSLTPSTGSLNPAFASGTTSYTMEVENETSTLTFNAVPNDSKAKASGTSCNLNEGANTCTITVTAEDGTKKSYTVNVTRKAGSVTPDPGPSDPEPTKSSDATLKSLTPSSGDLNPAFASGTNSYALIVGDDVDRVTFNAIPNDSKATVESGTSCTLNTGLNTCNIVVRAEDGTTKTYRVTVNRGSTDEPIDVEPVKNSDASLKSLDISGFTLTPRFNKNTTTYSIGVSNNITGLDVTAIPTDENATVRIIGNTNWVEGVNPVKIIVTAEDGTTRTYTINVTRASSNGGIKAVTDGSTSNNYLQSLVINNGELKPQFNKNTSNYNVVIGNQETKLDLSAIPEVDTSRVTIVGNDNLKVGVNTVTVEVTAKDGSLRVYTLNVTRSEKSADTKLKEINVGGGYSLSPSFSPDTYEYNITVPGTVEDLDISAIAKNANATVEITGNKKLKEGNNVVLLKVTDANGFTQYYRVNVEKKSGEKKFLGLTLKGWLVLLGILLALGLILFLILLLLNRKKKDEEETSNVNIKKSEAPVIEFKPEFNFGSKNGTDDDIVHEGGVLNQYSGVAPEEKIESKPKAISAKNAKVLEEPDDEEIPYDPYDDVVTKDEIIDALEEARETDDDSKLKMLYAQELLNRKKEEIKSKERKKRTSKK